MMFGGDKMMEIVKNEDKVKKDKTRGKKTILWVSKEHRPLPAQIAELERLFSDIKIVELIKFIPNADFVIKKAREVKADVVVPVLPMSFITRLVEIARPQMTVLWAKMERIHDCESINCPEFNPDTDTIVPGKEGGKPLMRHFRFKKFEEILGLNFVTRDLYSGNCVIVAKIEFNADNRQTAELIATDISNAIEEVFRQYGLKGEVRLNI